MVAAALADLASVAWLPAKPLRALTRPQESIAQFKEAGDHACISWSVSVMGFCMRYARDIRWSLQLYGGQRLTARGSAAKRAIAARVHSLGRLAHRCGVAVAFLKAGLLTSAQGDFSREARYLGAPEDAANVGAAALTSYDRSRFERCFAQIQAGLEGATLIAFQRSFVACLSQVSALQAPIEAPRRPLLGGHSADRDSAKSP